MEDSGFYGFTVRTIAGEDVSLSRYAGKVLLLVNVASECGFTPQYKGLEALYRGHRDRGFAVLGFPSDDFGRQEPGTDAEIWAFCERNYQVSFDLFSKVHVRGEPQAPLYRWLTTRPGFEGPVAWNFGKFLLGRDGRVLGRWASDVKPEAAELGDALGRALAL